MNEKALRTLEYNKIIEKLKNFAISPMGKELCAGLKPSVNITEIEKWQKDTTEASAMIVRKGNIPLGGIREIRPQIKRAMAGGTLNIEELMNVNEFLYVCRKVKNYSKNENKGESYESIDEMFEMVVPLDRLEAEISRCVVSEVEIADDASAKLREIRHGINVANNRIRDHLNSIINSPAYRNMLQDYVITIRNDRYCVPVKSEYRSSFNGMVHDQSNTGSTLFIEPMSVVQLNNKIKELQAEEKAEIEKILERLSDNVRENSDSISANIEIITQLDFIFAKGNLSLSMKGSEAVFNNNGYINIKKGRHPLLDDKTVVPTDIYLGKEFTTLLITGPNTGGKTVTLKTIGLFTLMGQAGLHIPAFDNSQLGVFDDVFADIGDEQSIEQNLSTFSAHMSNIVNILENVTDNSLVLFDELGAGTDPTEGAALAMAIVRRLMDRKIRTAVTTHYSELKVFALSTNGAENASCEFDVETLSPTYRLLIGIPGKSNAFAISKRLGLKDEIIEKAKEFLSHDETRFEDVITDLEISRKSVIYEQERAEQYRREAETLKKEAENQREKVNRQKEKILEKAREEAKMVYVRAKEEADAIIKEMNKNAREKAKQSDMNESRKKIKDNIENIDSQINKTLAQKRKNNKAPESIKPGDRVYVVSFDQHGTALTAPDSGKEVMVQMGSLKVKVPMKELSVEVYAEKQQPKSNFRSIPPKVRQSKSYSVSAEIDCRGQLVEEALGNIDKYIDDAYLSGLKQITIIHGKGTGALRSAVQTYLRTNPHVKSHRPGVYGEGEMGVTVVELK
ncbi:MAG: endonuclease MutS2 [Firmicutes bacterium]|nr:endonuclease MutS2 [Bacillota bacterium]